MLVCVGDLVEEVLVRLRADPVRGGDRHVRAARVRGGAAANVAAISSEQGRPSRFVGQVGDDHVGETLLEDLDRRGVSLHVERAGGTGVIVTMIGRGGRSRLIDRGASRRLGRLDPACLDGASQVFLAATAMTDDPFASAADALLGEVTDRGIPATLGGPTTSELDDFGAEPFLALCRTLRPAHVILARDEHTALGLRPRAGIDGAEVTVVTNGKKPTMVVAGADVDSVEVPPVDDVVDRTGVGDGFVAGFLASRDRGGDHVAATHAGHRTAAKVLRSFGPTTGTA
ncbi:MAG: carbohydrate kinase family protein [Actinomycetota bacterium]